MGKDAPGSGPVAVAVDGGLYEHYLPYRTCVRACARLCVACVCAV